MSAVRVSPKVKQRVLVADHDLMFARRMVDYLWDHGFEARAVQSMPEARAHVRDWRPQTVFVALNFSDLGAISLMRYINSDLVRIKPVVTVMAKPQMKSGLDEVKREGAKYSLLKPFSLEDVLKIVNAPAQNAEHKFSDGDPVKELHLLNLILRQAIQSEQPGRLFNLMRMINIKVKAVRTSLIECRDDKSGVVVASNDDENIGGHRLSLDKYPEIMAVRRTGKPLIISNIRTSDIMAPVQGLLAQAPYETIVLFPIHRMGKFYGVISLRMEQKDPVEMCYIEKFGQVCAHIMALSIAYPDHGVFQS